MFWKSREVKNGVVAGEGCLHSSGIPWPVVEIYQQ